MSKHKLDLFKTVLPNMDRHNHDLYRDLSPEEKKDFQGVVAMRFLSAAPSPYADWYLIAVNHYANQHFFDIYQHPELQYKLLAACGVGERVNHSWIGTAKKPSVTALVDFISRYWPNANRMEIDVILSKFDKDTFSDFVNGTGLDPDDAKKIKKSFAIYQGV